jgi:hypothetical protein
VAKSRSVSSGRKGREQRDRMELFAHELRALVASRPGLTLAELLGRNPLTGEVGVAHRLVEHGLLLRSNAGRYSVNPDPPPQWDRLPEAGHGRVASGLRLDGKSPGKKRKGE